MVIVLKKKEGKNLYEMSKVYATVCLLARTPSESMDLNGTL